MYSLACPVVRISILPRRDDTFLAVKMPYSSNNPGLAVVTKFATLCGFGLSLVAELNQPTNTGLQYGLIRFDFFWVVQESRAPVMFSRTPRAPIDSSHSARKTRAPNLIRPQSNLPILVQPIGSKILAVPSHEADHFSGPWPVQ